MGRAAVCAVPGLPASPGQWLLRLCSQFRSLVLLLPKHSGFGSVHLLRFTLRRMRARNSKRKGHLKIKHNYRGKGCLEFRALGPAANSSQGSGLSAPGGMRMFYHFQGNTKATRWAGPEAAEVLCSVPYLCLLRARGDKGWFSIHV